MTMVKNENINLKNVNQKTKDKIGQALNLFSKSGIYLISKPVENTTTIKEKELNSHFAYKHDSEILQ